MEDIDFLSVREESLKTFIEENSDRRAVTVLDPVLLHDADFYEKILEKPEEEPYVLLYYVMEKASDTIEAAAAYARRHGLKIIELTDLPVPGGRLGSREGVRCEFRYDIGAGEWLGYLRYAQCVFTNSFHAVCFCVLFETAFWAGARSGDKIGNILNLLHLRDRMLEAIPEARREERMDEKPDFRRARRALERKREMSERFLLDAVKSASSREKPRHSYDRWKRTLSYELSDGGGPGRLVFNDGSAVFAGELSGSKGLRFAGWMFQIKITDTWFVCTREGTLIRKAEFKGADLTLAGRLLRRAFGTLRAQGLAKRIGEDPFFRRPSALPKEEWLFAPGEPLPFLPVGEISLARAEAVWEKGDEETKKQPGK